MKTLITYFSALVSLSLFDFIWLTFIAKDFYGKYLGFLLSKEVNYAPIAFFYPIYSLVIVFLAVIPALAEQSLASALWRGALLGLAAYSAYDLTNHATIANWPLMVTIIDIAWGITATTLASGAAYLVISYFKF